MIACLFVYVFIYLLRGYYWWVRGPKRSGRALMWTWTLLFPCLPLVYHCVQILPGPPWSLLRGLRLSVPTMTLGLVFALVSERQSSSPPLPSFGSRNPCLLGAWEPTMRRGVLFSWSNLCHGSPVPRFRGRAFPGVPLLPWWWVISYFGGLAGLPAPPQEQRAFSFTFPPVLCKCGLCWWHWLPFPQRQKLLFLRDKWLGGDSCLSCSCTYVIVLVIVGFHNRLGA